MKPKTNAVVLVAAKDGGDGNRLKLENIGQFFQVSEAVSSERHQKLNMNSCLCHKYISYLVSGLSGMLYV